jgi:hypothetical protein
MWDGEMPEIDSHLAAEFFYDAVVRDGLADHIGVIFLCLILIDSIFGLKS